MCSADDRDVGGGWLQPVALLAALELARGALVEAAAVAESRWREAVREGEASASDNVEGLVIASPCRWLRGVGDGLVRAGVVVVDSDGQDDDMNAGLTSPTFQSDSVGRGVVRLSTVAAVLNLGVTRGRGGHVLGARGQRVGDDDVGHIGLAVEARPRWYRTSA